MGGNKGARLGWIGGVVLASAAAVMAGACTSTGQPQTGPAQMVGVPGVGQVTFASDEEAAKAVVDAVKAQDLAAPCRIFGPAEQDLVSGDCLEDRNERQEFAPKAAEQTRLGCKDERTTPAARSSTTSAFSKARVRRRRVGATTTSLTAI